MEIKVEMVEEDELWPARRASKAVQPAFRSLRWRFSIDTQYNNILN